MTLEQLNKLDNNEIFILLYLINNRKILPYDIGVDLICSIKHDFLCKIIIEGSDRLNDYGNEILNSIKFKLGLTSRNIPKMPCNILKNYSGYWLRRNRKRLTINRKS
jgi:hypothetical protein